MTITIVHMNNQKTNPRRSINCIMRKLTGNHRFETLKMPIIDRVWVLFTICAKCLSYKVETEVGRLMTTKSDYCNLVLGPNATRLKLSMFFIPMFDKPLLILF
jgi:hypothetical protein